MSVGEGALPAVLSKSAVYTSNTLEKLRQSITDGIGDQFDAVFGDHTTFMVTGSGGRGEMTTGSDIDGYVVRVAGNLEPEHDALLLEATKTAVEHLGLPALDRHGAFLEMKTASAVVDKLGSQEDDHSNAFTLRMLFLLESRPLVGDGAYDQLFEVVSDAYRSTATRHTNDFLPFFLVNDIIRYWRTVLLNHEEKLREKHDELKAEGLPEQSVRDLLLAHRRLRSQKLRFPRCLSCFSTLAYLLAVAPNDDDCITPQAEREMFDLTPIERLRQIARIQPTIRSRVDEMVDLYAAYLERTNRPKAEVLGLLQNDDDFHRQTSDGGGRFAKHMFHLIQELGGGNRLHRQMLI